MSRTIRKIRLRTTSSVKMYSGRHLFDQKHINALRAGKPPHPGVNNLRPQIYYVSRVLVREEVLEVMTEWDYVRYLAIQQKYRAQFDEIDKRRWTRDIVMVGRKYQEVTRSYRGYAKNPEWDEDISDAYNDWYRIHYFVYRNGSCVRQRRNAIRIAKQKYVKSRRMKEKEELRDLVRETLETASE